MNRWEFTLPDVFYMFEGKKTYCLFFEATLRITKMEMAKGKCTIESSTSIKQSFIELFLN